MTEIERKRLTEIKNDFMTQYELFKEILGDSFESVMADICVEIVDLQGKSTLPGGITFAQSTRLLLLPDPEILFDSDKNDEITLHNSIKAAYVWYNSKQGIMDDLLKELG